MSVFIQIPYKTEKKTYYTYIVHILYIYILYTKTVQQQNIIWTIFWIILLALAFTFNK